MKKAIDTYPREKDMSPLMADYRLYCKALLYQDKMEPMDSALRDWKHLLDGYVARFQPDNLAANNTSFYYHMMRGKYFFALDDVKRSAVHLDSSDYFCG